MIKDTDKIECPECGTSIDIDDVLTSQIEKKVREENKDKKAEIAKERKELEKKQKELDDEKENSDTVIQKQVEDRLKEEEVILRKKIQIETEEKSELEKKELEERLTEKDQKLKEASKNEIQLRKEKQQLKDEKDAFELEKERQLDDERDKIEEEASKKATEAKQSQIDQLNKKLSDANKVNGELARKLEQGSQQTQGEVLELELEDVIKREFPFDDISPVPKGVNGADVVQRVKDKNGNGCGQIIWESKNTKVWSDGWLQKLRDDQRVAKADIAVIVSKSLPKDTDGPQLREGVWICDKRFSVALATALRQQLILVSREKLMSVGKNEKMEILYGYLTGVEFKQRVEAIIEAFMGMDNGLKKEKLAYEKMWAEREKQIQKVITNTAGMYGDLSGLVTLPKIERLELPEGETDKKGKNK